MISPSPTSKIDPVLARGILGGISQPAEGKPALVTFCLPNTNYELHLVPRGRVRAEEGKRLVATVRAQARRIDVVASGGRYVEPVYGRPRRVQGRVIAIKDGAVVVDAGLPIHCTPTDPRQKPEGFEVGQFVSFDVLDGATIEQAGESAGTPTV